MGRRKKSGLFETLVKSAFGFGTTVSYKTDWQGRKQKIVKHHDSGKTKTYTQGCGILGNTTRTETTKNGRTVESGTVRKNYYFNGATEHAKRSDGTNVTRNYSRGVFGDAVTTTEKGICFKCNGEGSVTLNCKICSGSGIYTFKEKSCFSCKGTGVFNEHQCRKCQGTGVYKAAESVPCKKCDGKGTFKLTCNRCEGSGQFRRVSHK